MARILLLAMLCIGVPADKGEVVADADESKAVAVAGEVEEEPEYRCLIRYHLMSKSVCASETTECPMHAPYIKANISVEGDSRVVQTSYCPPYDWSCIRHPKNLRPCGRKTTFKIPTKPVVAKKPIQLGLGWPRGGLPRENASRFNSRALNEVKPMLGAIGVLVNGVAINAVGGKLSETLEEGQELEGEDAWVDAGEAEQWMDDHCGGHLSGGSNYHTHLGSQHSIYGAAARRKCGLPEDEPGKHSVLLGWAFDGYGIYGPLEDGVEGPIDLDECGGHIGQPEQSGYHYHMQWSYPYGLECYHGCPTVSNNFRFKDLVCEAKKPGEEEL